MYTVNLFSVWLIYVYAQALRNASYCRNKLKYEKVFFLVMFGENYTVPTIFLNIYFQSDLATLYDHAVEEASLYMNYFRHMLHPV